MRGREDEELDSVDQLTFINIPLYSYKDLHSILRNLRLSLN